MATYSNYFSFGSGPKMETRSKYMGANSGGNFRGNYTYDVVVGPEQDKKAAKAFDDLMAGHDATSQAYVNQLQSIYDGYQKYAQEFGDNAKPIMEALTGDITEMQGFIKDYGDTLDEIRPTMMDGINVDPSATRTREEYQGNVAASFDKQRQQQKMNMVSQGLNPFANKGADRQMALSEAAAMTDAGNTAYRDWRTQHNNDIQAKQKGQATYAGLIGQKGVMQGQIMDARRGLIDTNKSIMEAKIGAGQASAAGVTDLLSLAENRRQEALKLGQQQQENARTDADIMQQLGAKLTSRDKYIANNSHW